MTSAPAHRPEEASMLQCDLPSFDKLVLPHLGAAYNLARWLVRNDQDAEDVVQEATLRALRFFDGFSGHNPRAWLLTVVRNSACTFLTQKRSRQPEDVELDEQPALEGAAAETPESLLLTSARHRLLDEAVQGLAEELREVFILREAEGLSYKEIAEVAGIPIGTVMSRLSRARRQLRAAVSQEDSRATHRDSM
jgi:RNA polymerase sigma-70 factor (ECF subfamily)